MTEGPNGSPSPGIVGSVWAVVTTGLFLSVIICFVKNYSNTVDMIRVAWCGDVMDLLVAGSNPACSTFM